jgi:hypothetical protein
VSRIILSFISYAALTSFTGARLPARGRPTRKSQPTTNSLPAACQVRWQSVFSCFFCPVFASDLSCLPCFCLQVTLAVFVVQET